MLKQQTMPPTSVLFQQPATGARTMDIHVDRGPRLGMQDGLGRYWFSCNAGGFVLTQEFDILNRVVSDCVSRRGDPSPASVYSRTRFGDSLPPDEARSRNLGGRLTERFGQAGWARMEGRTLAGDPNATTTALSRAYQTAEGGMPAIDIPPLDGAEPCNAGLQARSYTTALQRHDAFGRALEAVNPNGNVACASFLLSGVTAVAGVDGQCYLQNLRYNARSQLLSAVTGLAADGSGGGLLTSVYRYDTRSFLRSQAYATLDPDFIAALPGGDRARIDGSADSGRRQDTCHALDPNGNVCGIDDAWPAVVFGQPADSRSADSFAYDAVYRLLTATGTENPACSPTDSGAGTGFAAGALPIGPAGYAALAPYLQRYAYDDGGNITGVSHFSNGILDDRRSMAMKVSSGSNRSVSAALYASMGGTETATEIGETFFAGGLFDAAGNQLQTASLAGMQWDFQGQMAQSSYAIPGDPACTATEYHVYVSGAIRTRKITVTRNADGLIVRLDTVTYLGEVELRASYRQADPAVGIDYDGETVGNAVPTADYSELRIMLGQVQAARILRGTLEEGAGPAVRTWYSLCNHIGSCQAELDEQGSIANYQSFYPYGGTSLAASGGDGISLVLKQIQYSGKEKDGSGLAFYGFRHYDASAFRWTRPDPAGMAGSGLNLYAMVGGNPVTLRDTDGLVGNYAYFRAGIPIFVFCVTWSLFFYWAAAAYNDPDDRILTLKTATGAAIVGAGRHVARIVEAATTRALSLRHTETLNVRDGDQGGGTLTLNLELFPASLPERQLGQLRFLAAVRGIFYDLVGEGMEHLALVGFMGMTKETHSASWSIIYAMSAIGAIYAVLEVNNIAARNRTKDWAVTRVTFTLNDANFRKPKRCCPPGIAYLQQVSSYDALGYGFAGMALHRADDSASQAATRMWFPTVNIPRYSGFPWWVLRNALGRALRDMTPEILKCAGLWCGADKDMRYRVRGSSGQMYAHFNGNRIDEIYGLNWTADRAVQTKQHVQWSDVAQEAVREHTKHLKEPIKTRVGNTMFHTDNRLIGAVANGRSEEQVNLLKEHRENSKAEVSLTQASKENNQ